ncbi:hypothetical protein N5079_25725 [Planotetraspora sp. A-T 1434]|uniref:hypothetical protein n=1 Tax=Planotetraspora sp. A-T 1434 TaxID=2979219 RepID=UPI0021BF45FB|nr:hypothetical protein [Planotetraspora sp. A-T 1434]MCT9933619.1 hypothetical protein [Planotetraspora sp. A-T 1434]
MALERSVSTTPESPGWSPDTFTQMTDHGTALLVMYGTAWRLHRHLLAICAMTVLPGIATLLVVLVAMGHGVVLFNGSPRLVESSPVMIGVLAVTAVATILGGLLCLAAGARLVLDFIEGQPLSAGRAVLRILRRSHSFLLLTLQFGLVLFGLLVGASWISTQAASIVPGLILLIAAGIFALPTLIAWAALADRVLPLETTMRLIARDYVGVIWMTGLGFVALPGLVHLGLYGLGAAFPVETGAPISDALRLVASILLAPFQAATLACCYAYLRQAGRESTEPAPGGGPARGTRRAGWWPLILALLPGLLYGTYLVANPRELVSVIDNEVGTNHLTRYPTTQITYLPNGRPVIIRADGDPTLTFCDDATCGGHTTVTLKQYFDIHPAVTVTADGSVLIAGWVLIPGGRDRMELHLFSCRPTGCARRSGPPLRARDGSWLEVHAAAVATANGIAIASIAPGPGGRYGETALVQLALCRDFACADHRTIPLGTVTNSTTSVSLDNRILAITATADGRPVIAYTDRSSQKTTVARCDSAACVKPAINTFDASRSELGLRATGSFRGQIALRPDDRPVLVLNDPEDDTAKIFTCADPACSQPPREVRVPEIIALGAPGLALDSRGRPMLAGYDRASDRLAVLSCQDDRCDRRAETPLIRTFGGVGHLDAAVGPDRRTHILWYGSADPTGTDAYHFLTCAAPGCA